MLRSSASSSISIKRKQSFTLKKRGDEKWKAEFLYRIPSKTCSYSMASSTGTMFMPSCTERMNLDWLLPAPAFTGSVSMPTIASNSEAPRSGRA
jgi:hypothetical protein